ncbi:unnamed protein product [Protopolystoma xenopodis]|uniref:Uncharacterized protein n=1 Tax=Protopolystoma xenopodis TaxID=117903 RepID=A0A3S5B2N6_9PLAT|nr:unnamed protein product [Protopolystoma xenopodis]
MEEHKEAMDFDIEDSNVSVNSKSTPNCLRASSHTGPDLLANSDSSSVPEPFVSNDIIHDSVGDRVMTRASTQANVRVATVFGHESDVPVIDCSANGCNGEIENGGQSDALLERRWMSRGTQNVTDSLDNGLAKSSHLESGADRELDFVSIDDQKTSHLHNHDQDQEQLETVAVESVGLNGDDGQLSRDKLIETSALAPNMFSTHLSLGDEEEEDDDDDDEVMRKSAVSNTLNGEICEIQDDQPTTPDISKVSDGQDNLLAASLIHSELSLDEGWCY